MRQRLDWTSLLASLPPWAHLICCEETDLESDVYRFRERETGSRDTLIRIIRAQQCPTWHLNYTWWAAALEFPGYFGYGGSAFKDCVTDLSWLPADHYVFVVTRAYMLLQQEPEGALRAFLDLLEEAALVWTNPKENLSPSQDMHGHKGRRNTPFHVLFHCEADLETYTRHIYARAGIWLSTITFSSIK